MSVPAAHRGVPALACRDGGAREMTRALPEEVPVALVYNGTTQAVMMATPADLEDFARGFSLTEGIVADASEIGEIEIVTHDAGIEARMWLPGPRAERLAARRRAMAGPVGCGLCGIDSLDQAMRPLPALPAPSHSEPAPWPFAALAGAPEALRAAQVLHDRTGAVHAAGFLTRDGLAFAREDVGRHNALDKLIGAMAASGAAPRTGAIVLTSRVSVEMVQKCAMAGCPVLVAVSAPTARAVALAEEAGVTVAALARGGGFEIFCHPGRIDTRSDPCRMMTS